MSKAIDKAAGAEREVIGDHHRHGGGSPVSGSMSGPLGTASILPLTAPATDAAKQWDGWGTALKPAWEPIILARKPLQGTVAANILKHGTGALNIDGCRIEYESNPRHEKGGSYAIRKNNTAIFGAALNDATQPNDLGRWPANVVLDDLAAALLDEQSGELNSGGGNKSNISPTRASQVPPTISSRMFDTDQGGASRFFYCAKPSREERDYGCEALTPRTTIETVQRMADSAGAQNPRAGAGRGAGAPIYRCARCALNLQGGRAATSCTDGSKHEPVLVGHGDLARNHHPTVKPVELMRWLVRLVTPPGGLVLDPFTGSGTTGIAALAEGFAFHGIESDETYVEIANARIIGSAPLFNQPPPTPLSSSTSTPPTPAIKTTLQSFLDTL